MEGLLLVLLVLLLQLSHTAFFTTGEVVYKCTSELSGAQHVRDPSAQLTKGCVLKDVGITFHLHDMFKNPKDPVVINISETIFVNSPIKIIKFHYVRNIDDLGPLLLTISDSEMSGTSELKFGSSDNNNENMFKLPPHSRLRIIRCKMSISSAEGYSSIIMFNAFELVTNSSMEIAHNVITMEYKRGNRRMAVFYLRNSFVLSDTSSFTLRDNEINMNACCDMGNSFTEQLIWYQHNVGLEITKSSNFIWASNIISMVINGGKSTSVFQYVWYTSISLLLISDSSHLLLDSNRILMLAVNYKKTIYSSVMAIDGSGRGSVSNGSSMVWRDNCVGMGHKKTDKRHVFAGKWSITERSELLWDANYFTTTDEYGQSGSGLTYFLWGLKGETVIKKDRGSKLSIVNTKVHSNGAAGSMLWNSSLYKHDTSYDFDDPFMDWSSSPAKDAKGSPIPTLDNSNIRKYMCVIPSITPTATVTPTLHVPNTPSTDNTIPIVQNPETKNPKGQTNVVTEIIPSKPGLTKRNNTPATSDNTIPIVQNPETKDPKGQTNVVKEIIPSKPGLTKRNNTTTTSALQSDTAVISIIPAVLFTSVVLLYLYN